MNAESYEIRKAQYSLQQAHTYASARNLYIQNWTPPSESSLKARREVGRVASHFAFPGVDPEITEHALKCAPSACTALIEASFIHTSMGSFAHRDTYEDFRRQLDAHNCNPDILKAIQQKGGLGVQKARYFFSGKNSLELFRERN